MLKKSLSLILCVCIALICVSCGSGSDDASSGAPDAAGSTTLMIYMIGSDLESRSGSATDDIAEIEQSGVDTDRCSVVLYTGGSSKWYTELTDSAHDSILSLTADGFVSERQLDPAPMGEPDTLSSFLDYCVDAHPADHYALILWDHGSGPLIGYGKDTLNGGDSLTLSEMAQAMQDSPFSAQHKLEWVGFDACLMASAELVCVWKDYARYMVASQEVEPAFGWSYSFLGQLGSSDTPALISDAADRYLTSCTEYYERRDYHDRDTTLACFDLSYADALADSVNALFSAAADDVDRKYDVLAARRVSTRALGRASTGSEYDLVDLRDLSQQLRDDYPSQAAAIADAVDKTVIKNATNAEGLCGLSIYYPFYNKSYYTNQWSDTYSSMNIFPDYVRYLSVYAKIWLDEDMRDDYATSDKPTMTAAGDYSLQLTDDQAAHYASAKYYILKKEGSETYTCVFSGSDVTCSGGTLSADFDGSVIYAHDDLGAYILPVTVEHDTVGRYTNYSIPVTLDSSMGGSYISAALDGQDDVQFLKCRFLVAADKTSGEIAVSALMPYDTALSGSDLSGGKAEEIDASDYTTYLFSDEPRRTITRTDSGVIRPVDEWRASSVDIWNEISIADGLEFVYAPLAYGDYALIFEICDTQGSRYCSSLIDIDTAGIDWLDQKADSEPTVVQSKGTYPLLLKEDDSFALYLDTYTKVDSYSDTSTEHLTVYAVNKTDRKLNYFVSDFICNGNISCDDATGLSDTLDPREASLPYYDYFDEFYEENGIEKTPTLLDLGVAEDIGALKKLSSLSFTAKVRGYEDKKTVWRKEYFTVNFDRGKEFTLPAETWSKPLLDDVVEPPFGAVIKSQKLIDSSDMLIELLCMGVRNDYLEGAFRIVNRSDGMLYLDSDGIAVDDIFYDSAFAAVELAPGAQAYRRLFVSAEKLAEAGIDGMQKLQITFRTAPDSTILWQGYGTAAWYDIKLSSRSASPSSFRKTASLLMDENDVAVSFIEYKQTDYGTRYWYMAVDNRRAEGIMIDVTALTVNDTPISDDYLLSPIYLSCERTGPKQRSVLQLVNSSFSYFEEEVDRLSFRFVVYDFTGEKILFHGKTTVDLKAQ